MTKFLQGTLRKILFALDLLSEKVRENFIGVPDESDWKNARKIAHRMKDKFDKYWKTGMGLILEKRENRRRT